MSINYKIINESRCIKIIAKGSCENLNQLEEYVLDIHNATIASGQTRVFVDETRLAYNLSTLDSFNSGCLISQLTPRPHKIAVLCKSDGWSDVKFWETVAVNRGVFVKVFKDQDRAEKWIFS